MIPFSDGYQIVTSYRNSKNYGDNWISAGYALWFLRESRYLNHARFLLGTSCAVSGTGFLFSRRVLEVTMQGGTRYQQDPASCSAAGCWRRRAPGPSTC